MLSGDLDPALLQLRAALAPQRRRLWLRRTIRRAWIALAAVAIAETGLWALARWFPLEGAPVVAAAIPIVVITVLAIACARARPSIGETALAVDAEGGLGDRVSSALELAVGFPDSATPPSEAHATDAEQPEDDAGRTDRFVRRQRMDALTAIRRVPRLFTPRLSRAPAIASLVAGLVLIPVLALPNPQDAVIAQQRDIRAAAERQAQRLDDTAKELEAKGADTQDPRTQLAKDLRDLARQLRDKPADLATNLARLGAIESGVRAQIDPGTEQHAAAMTSLSRALSRATTGNPDANRDGDPNKTKSDLEKLKSDLPSMTPDKQRDMARQLAQMASTASGADGGAATALQDAAQSLAQGDTASAQSALDRLSQALGGAQSQIAQSRDLGQAA
ncbi:MAG TPA: hypothetical protein VE640_10570, partial [Candidatus Bathyarchaeia archaeon]|nr:hypothetical protein [Candidatus Bathyarchaeia archaeon]